MMTPQEAKQRLALSGATARRTGAGTEYRVTLNEWRGAEAERKAYYTDDLEDAVFTAQDMRKREPRS